jgi:hypothetical protein
MSHFHVVFHNKKNIYLNNLTCILEYISENMSTTLQHQESIEISDVDEGLYSRQL